MADLSEVEAKEVLAGILVNLDDVRELVARLFEGRGWLALGYESWSALVAAEIRPCMPMLDRAERKALVAELAGAGMSSREIAPIVGAGHATVSRDLAPVSNETATAPTDEALALARLERALTAWRKAADAFRIAGIELPAWTYWRSGKRKTAEENLAAMVKARLS